MGWLSDIKELIREVRALRHSLADLRDAPLTAVVSRMDLRSGDILAAKIDGRCSRDVFKNVKSAWEAALTGAGINGVTVEVYSDMTISIVSGAERATAQ